MMKVFKILAVAMAALVMFSCSKEDQTSKKKEGKSSMTVVFENLVTKADVSTGGTVISAIDNSKSGFIYVFTDAGVSAIESGAVAINLTDGKQEIDEVSNLATEVYIVANAPDGVFTATMNKASLLAAVVDLANVLPVYASTDTHGLLNAMMHGNGTVREATEADADIETDLISEVDLAPSFARLEMTSITGNRTLTTAEIEAGLSPLYSYTLDAIVANKLHPDFTWAGAFGTLIDEATPAPTENSWMADVLNQAVANDAIATPIVPTNGVWAYHVAAGDSPRLVLKLSDIQVGTTEADATPLIGGRYVNIRFEDGSNNPVIFQRGYIYSVGALEFNSPDMATKTEEEIVGLTAVVTVKAWDVGSSSVVIGPDPVTP